MHSKFALTITGLLHREIILYDYIMKKLLGIVVLGLLKSYPIDYGRTCARLAQREINS